MPRPAHQLSYFKESLGRRMFGCAAILLATLTSSPSLATSGTGESNSCKTSPEASTRFKEGDEHARAACVRMLEDHSFSKLGFEGVKAASLELHRFYQKRTGRQQTWIDSGARLSFGASVLSALTKGATSAEYGLWAIAPAMLSQFEAYEPTSKLFAVGDKMLMETARRYFELDSNMKAFSELGSAFSKEPSKKADATCIELSKQLNIIVTWQEGVEARSVFLNEGRQLLATCDKLPATRHALLVFEQQLKFSSANLGSAMAADLVRLDHMLTIRDQSLRTTPISAVGRFLGAPFLAVGGILSNEGGKSAIDALRTQAALGGLALPLTKFEFIDPKSLGVQPQALSTDFNRLSGATRPTGADPSQEDVVAAANAIRGAFSSIRAEAAGQEARAQLGTRIVALGSLSSISASVDQSNGGVVVELK